VNRQRIKNQGIFLLVRSLSALMQALPLGLARGLGAGLGRLFCLLVPYERRKALRTAGLAFPEKSPAERRALVSAAFAHLGRGGAEFLRFPGLDGRGIDALVSRVEGLHAFTALARSRRGVVAVTGHMGNWELMMAWIAVHFPGQAGAVAQKLYDARFDEALNGYRQAKGARVFARNTAVRPILRFLKEGGMLGALADQDTNVDSLWVPFFNRPSKTPSGPAWMAQATGAALITLFNWREPDGRYVIRFEGEIAVPPRGESLEPAVAEYTRRIEAALRRHPEQWVWMHERWRSRPPASRPKEA
jgi:KDO2-lipid IV(A) lauroyltransferase